MIDNKKIEEWERQVADGESFDGAQADMLVPALLRDRTELVALLREVQLAPLRAQDGRALVTLDLETLRRIAAATGG